MAAGIDSQYATEKRQLRAAIARSRRRIDRHIRKSGNASRRLTSWKTYASRWPAAALAAGLGLGWILAAGLRPRFLVTLFGGRVLRQLSGRATDLLLGELKRFLSDAAPGEEGENAKGDDDA